MKSLLCTILVSLASLASSQATYDVYIKFTGGSNITTGDGEHQKYKKEQGWFKLTEFSFGIENQVTVGGPSGGIGSEKSRFEAVNITKRAGAGSAKLFLACASGVRFEKLTIVFVRSGADYIDKNIRILEMDYYHVVIQSVKTAGSDGDEILNEDVVFKHGSQKLQFFTQNSETGAEESAGEARWSVIENIAVAP